jgi:tetratricopeptide (TPR) repeat protein
MTDATVPSPQQGALQFPRDEELSATSDSVHGRAALVVVRTLALKSEAGGKLDPALSAVLGADDAVVASAWAHFLSRELITVQELSAALRDDAVAHVFQATVDATAVAALPRWSKCRPAADLARSCSDDGEQQRAPASDSRFPFASSSTLPLLDAVDPADAAVVIAGACSAAARPEALRLKDAGNAHFGSRRYAEALAAYKEGIAALTTPAATTATPGVSVGTASSSGSSAAVISKPNWSLGAVLFSNAAQAHIMLEEWAAARRAASAALVLDPSNEKAQFRKQKAQEAIEAKLGGIDKEARMAAMQNMCAQQ